MDAPLTIGDKVNTLLSKEPKLSVAQLKVYESPCVSTVALSVTFGSLQVIVSGKAASRIGKSRSSTTPILAFVKHPLIVFVISKSKVPCAETSMIKSVWPLLNTPPSGLFQLTA